MGNLLALDQSSKITGYAIFKNGQYFTHGLITSNSTDLGVRLKHLRDELQKLIKEYDITEVIFEDIQLQSNVANNVTTFKTLAEVIGVISELFTELKIPYSAVLAGVWRKQLAIGGRDRTTQKKKAQNYVLNRYTLNVSEDEADAICIGHYHKSTNNSDVFDWTT